MKMNERAFDELINMYEDAVKEAQILWLSNYCCSKEETDLRKAEDALIIKEFVDICNRLKGDK